MSDSNARERLVQAGIEELGGVGVQGFSLRRVAARCGLSCAAPYRHFSDKQQLLQAVAEAMNEAWFNRQSAALKTAGENNDARLRTVCKEYLRFLMENPGFCELATQRDPDSGRWRLNTLFDQSTVTRELIRRYIDEHQLDDEEAYIRTCMIRALIYGAALMNRHDDMRLSGAVLRRMDAVLDEQI